VGTQAQPAGRRGPVRPRSGTHGRDADQDAHRTAVCAREPPAAAAQGPRTRQPERDRGAPGAGGVAGPPLGGRAACRPAGLRRPGADRTAGRGAPRAGSGSPGASGRSPLAAGEEHPVPGRRSRRSPVVQQVSGRGAHDPHDRRGTVPGAVVERAGTGPARWSPGRRRTAVPRRPARSRGRGGSGPSRRCRAHPARPAGVDLRGQRPASDDAVPAPRPPRGPHRPRTARGHRAARPALRPGAAAQQLSGPAAGPGHHPRSAPRASGPVRGTRLLHPAVALRAGPGRDPRTADGASAVRRPVPGRTGVVPERRRRLPLPRTQVGVPQAQGRRSLQLGRRDPHHPGSRTVLRRPPGAGLHRMPRQRRRNGPHPAGTDLQPGRPPLLADPRVPPGAGPLAGGGPRTPPLPLQPVRHRRPQLLHDRR
jgi:hypothetical protein